MSLAAGEVLPPLCIVSPARACVFLCDVAPSISILNVNAMLTNQMTTSRIASTVDTTLKALESKSFPS